MKFNNTAKHMPESRRHITLKWQAQKDDTCWITALSILSGIPVPKLLTQFCSYQLGPRCSYSRLHSEPHGLWYTYANRLLTDITPVVEALHSGPYNWTHILPSSQKCIDKPKLSASLLHGKGLLTIYGRINHAVAFENGLIFDSACIECSLAGQVQPFREWKKHKHCRIKGWRIDRIAN